MTIVRNTSEQRRRWDWLTNTRTRRTLELDSGAMADTVLPDGFSDPYLAVVQPPAPPAPPPPPPVDPSQGTDESDAEPSANQQES